MEPLISVLITSYNAGSYIKEAIESVLKQTYQNWELIILDDCSKDNTRNVIDSFNESRIKKIYRNSNIGYVASKNILLKEFKGEYACFLDADDWMHAGRLEEQVQVFLDTPGLGACMCNYVRVQPDGQQSEMNFFAYSKFLDLKIDDIHFAGAGIMFSKKVVETIGGFEMYFDRLLGDDNYWVFKVAEKFKFYYLNKPLYYYRANSQSITNNIDNLRKLSIIDLLIELKKQRAIAGTDWVEKGEFEDALRFEQSLLDNKKWLAEKLRIAAAVKIDYKDFKNAKTLLKDSLQHDPISIKSIGTIAYLLRETLKGYLGDNNKFGKYL